MTAAELMAKLNADAEFIAARKRQDEELAKRSAEYRAAETPLLNDLKASGYDVESAWDLVNTSGSYLPALPILLEHLPRPYPPAVREGIARALAVPETKAIGWELLKRLYRHEKEARVSDGLAVAIAASADDDALEEVIELAADQTLGGNRVLLLRALERSKNPRAQEALAELNADPQLQTEIGLIYKRLEQKKKRREARKNAKK
jgi:hypothetical protein